MSTPADNRLILCAASVRSLAESAIQAGFFPICLDFFGDSDLRSLVAEFRSPAEERRRVSVEATVRQLSCFEEVLAATREFDTSVPCLWAGGLENYPEILEALAKERLVLGASPAAIRQVRDPCQLAAWLSEAGCLFPATRIPATRTGPGSRQTCGQPTGSNHRWLLKSLRGSGGHGVREFFEGAASGPGPERDSILQQWVAGIPMSATFLATPQEICLIGCTLQLCGWQSLGAPAFGYCGNWGPVRPQAHVIDELVHAATVVARRSGLTGVFGLDFVLGSSLPEAEQQQPGRPWILEVNPRITAAHELFEFAAGVSLLSAHAACFDSSQRLNSIAFRSPPLPGTNGGGHWPQMLRMIAYARQDIEVTAEFLSCLDLNRQIRTGRSGAAVRLPGAGSGGASGVRLADLPCRGNRIAAGHPVCSVYFTGTDGSHIAEQIESVTGGSGSFWGLQGWQISRQFVQMLDDFREACSI